MRSVLGYSTSIKLSFLLSSCMTPIWLGDGFRHELSVFSLSGLPPSLPVGPKPRNSPLFFGTKSRNAPLSRRWGQGALLIEFIQFSQSTMMKKNTHRKKLDSKGLMSSTKFLYFYETLRPCHSPLGGFRSRISAIFFGKLRERFSV